jgi:SagB-type dehydrogenase family enzyme
MNRKKIELPSPQLKGDRSLEEIIAHRRSERRLSDRALSWEQIGQMAWAAQGITGGDSRWRTAPSAGALHPLELYVLLRDTAYRYDPVSHELRFHVSVDLSEVAAAALSQEFIAQAPCVFAFGADIRRTTRVYKKRGWNYICMDLGHSAQNLLLQAAALGLAGTPVGALDEEVLGALLRLPTGHVLLYLVPVGYPE